MKGSEKVHVKNKKQQKLADLTSEDLLGRRDFEVLLDISLEEVIYRIENINEFIYKYPFNFKVDLSLIDDNIYFFSIRTGIRIVGRVMGRIEPYDDGTYMKGSMGISPEVVLIFLLALIVPIVLLFATVSIIGFGVGLAITFLIFLILRISMKHTTDHLEHSLETLLESHFLRTEEVNKLFTSSVSTSLKER